MRTGGLQISPTPFNGRLEILVYDLDAGVLVEELTDYAIFLSRQQLDEKTVLNRMYHLKRFWEFLKLNRISIHVDEESKKKQSDGQGMRILCDARLSEFRDDQLVKIMSSVRAKAKERTSKQTVNTRLCAVYAWLCWLQQDRRVSPGLIGASGARVRSTLPERATSSGSGSHRYRLTGMAQTDYPLFFRRTGKSTKHKRAYVPTEDDRLKVVEMMQAEAGSAFISHRNVLIVDIADATGMRRGSINSLCAEQFLEPASGEYAYVTPSHQKFSYNDSVAFPMWLYLRVQHYCKEYLQPMASTRGWGQKVTEGRIFLSARDGRPLTDRSLTHIVRGYMRQAAGAPPGASVHSFRHRFVNEEIRKETLYRMKVGLDTSTTTIAAVVSLRVGHKNPESLYPYVAFYQSVGLLREQAEVLAAGINLPGPPRDP